MNLSTIRTQGSHSLALGLPTHRCFAAVNKPITSTQGSQSLALGLTTTAASQLVYSGLMTRPALTVGLLPSAFHVIFCHPRLN